MADLGAAAAHAEIEEVELDAAEEINRLAALNEIEYERQRPRSAKELQIRAPVLDRLVQKERKALDVDDDGKQGRSRYGGMSDMSLWRWLQDDGLSFPQPIRINNRRFWLLSDLLKWEHKRAGRVA